MQQRTPFLKRVDSRTRQEWVHACNNWRLWHLARQVSVESPLRELAKTPPEVQMGKKPVAVFNASTRLAGISLNASFALLAALGLQMAGIPVVYFACKSGMSRCMLGTNREEPERLPPCRECIWQSRFLFSHAPIVWFEYHVDPVLAKSLLGLSVLELSDFVFRGLPLGKLVLPGLRWVLRRYNLIDNDQTQWLFREYILSAYRIAQEFNSFLEQVEPFAVIVFNGLTYPEAVVRFVANQRKVRVITHEVGLRAFSAFFTDGDATAYPIEIPNDFELNPEENALLDAYLEQRFKGHFMMAGIRFWPEMQSLNEAFLEKAACFRQIVSVFTNVIFDTSQSFANTIFPDMFAWLDEVFRLIQDHRDTLFVIRAHPDESRVGKESQESVQMWAEKNKLSEQPNAVFIRAEEHVSSYELVQRSKFVMVYNSSIGLEASLMGLPVLSAGRSRFTQYPTVFFPSNAEIYREMVEEFIMEDQIEVPPEHKHNARRFLYFQLFKVSLPVEDFFQEGDKPGYLLLKSFSVDKLKPERSPTIQAILNGILFNRQFELAEGRGKFTYAGEVEV